MHVHDVVQANIKAAMVPGVSGAFNIGSGTRISINDVMERLKATRRLNPAVRHGPPRPWNVRDRLADISAARKAFGFEPEVTMDEGLPEYIQWAGTEVAL